MTPRQFGPMTRMPCARACSTTCLLERGALGPDLLEARRDDDDAADAGLAALLDEVRASVGGGVTMTARSTGSGMAVTLGCAWMPEHARAGAG